MSLKKQTKNKNILFSCIQSNPKSFLSIFFIKTKNKFAYFSCFKNAKLNIITSLWLSVRVWSKYQKPLTNHFVHFIFKVLGFSCRL